MAFALARKYEQKKNTKKVLLCKKILQKKYCKKEMAKKKRNCEMGKENKANFIMRPWGGRVGKKGAGHAQFEL